MKRPADVVGNYPNDGTITRLIGVLPLERNDELRIRRRHMQVEAFSRIDAAADCVLSITTAAA